MFRVTRRGISANACPVSMDTKWITSRARRVGGGLELRNSCETVNPDVHAGDPSAEGNWRRLPSRAAGALGGGLGVGLVYCYVNLCIHSPGTPRSSVLPAQTVFQIMGGERQSCRTSPAAVGSPSQRCVYRGRGSICESAAGRNERFERTGQDHPKSQLAVSKNGIGFGEYTAGGGRGLPVLARCLCYIGSVYVLVRLEPDHGRCRR